MSTDRFIKKEGSHAMTIVSDEEPSINVVDKSDFLNRARIVFQAYDDILKKTLGAYGSPTIISNYPYKDVTKDGYTVARNLEFDMEGSSDIDKVIGGMIMDICSRLNYAVGDGTTTAIVATNKIFQELFTGMENYLTDKHIRAKDFMEEFNEIKDEIVERLESMATPITEENLVDTIRKIVTVSSNGNKDLIDGITGAYEEIGFPAIICEKSDNHKTYCDIVDGYRAKVMLCDKVYINTDKQSADYTNADVIIFERKITSAIYNKIIKPINAVSRACGRKLICLAPYYDEVALSGEIRRELMAEFNKTGTINLVICTYFNSTKVAKQQISDLATILGTVVIDHALENQLLEASESLEGSFIDVINIFDRGIDGILIARKNDEPDLVRCVEGFVNEERKEKSLFTLGFTDTASIGLKQAIFKSTHYSKELYDVTLQDAKSSLDEAIEKFKELGTYTREVYDCQTRYCSLKMKLATLYVGGDSDLSQSMNKDAADDAIRAAESAYQFGYVKGCNLSITKIINEMLKTERKAIRVGILKGIGKGFMNVCTEVMRNAFPYDDKIAITDIITEPYKIADKLITEYGIKIDKDKLGSILVKYPAEYPKFDDCDIAGSLTIAELMSVICIIEDKVFDLSIMDFSDDVINSVKTDIEVLSASSELLSILTVGNQVVLSAWNHKHYN